MLIKKNMYNNRILLGKKWQKQTIEQVETKEGKRTFEKKMTRRERE